MTSKPPSVNQALYARNRASVRTGATVNAFATFEANKAIWTATHPDATSDQYQQAMRAIARDCGV